MTLYAVRHILSGMDIEKMLIDAIERDPRSLFALARDSGLSYSTLHRFASGERRGITIQVAWKLCEQLNLELRPKEPKPKPARTPKRGKRG